MSYENYMEQYDKIGYSPQGIKHIRNFIDPKDLEYLVSFLGADESFGNIYKEDILDSHAKLLLNNYEDSAYQEVLSAFSEPYQIEILEEPRNEAHLTKWNMLLGSSMNIHSDAETPSRKPAIAGGFYRYNITAIAYLTDEYLGGELCFPEFDDLTIKPKAGDLLLFPSRYRHAIKTLQSGERYTMPMFFGFDVEDDLKLEDIFTTEGQEDPSHILFFE